MRMLFRIEDQVNQFKIQGEMNAQDISVLKQGLFRFFESNPTYTLLDLSQSSCEAGSTHALTQTLAEIQSLTSSKSIHFTIAKTPLEAIQAKDRVLEAALLDQVNALQSKLETRETMRLQAEKLIEENQKLKSQMLDQAERLKAESPASSSLLNPLLEKLWSEK